jgi:hypothetical protein
MLNQPLRSNAELLLFYIINSLSGLASCRAPLMKTQKAALPAIPGRFI